MTRRTLARVAFLTVTAGAIAMELWYAFDGDKDTEPYTEYLIRLPWLVLVPLAVGFSVWLPWHLFASKRRGHKPKT